MWAPFLQEMKEREDIAQKAKEQNKYSEEIELEEVELQLKRIRNDKLISAASIKNYYSLLKQKEQLQFTIDYYKWFEKRKKDVEEFMCELRDKFLLREYDSVQYMFTDSDKTKIMSDRGLELESKFIAEFLRRYGYYYDVNFYEEKPSFVRISYERKEF